MAEQEMSIVVEDPEGQYFEGSLVDRQKAAQLEARGVALMPVDPRLFQNSAVGGYFKRAWGSGLPLDSLFPRVQAPMILYCDPQYPVLHWRTRVVASEEFLELDRECRTGGLHIATDTSQRTPFSATVGGVTSTLVRELGAPDHDHGWVIGGTAVLTCGHAGHVGLCLYGHAPGLRVLWAAVSTTQEMIRQ
jgi:hypothetical protein